MVAGETGDPSIANDQLVQREDAIGALSSTETETETETETDEVVAPMQAGDDPVEAKNRTATATTSEAVLELSGRVGIAEVSALHERMVALLEAGGRIVVDASALEGVDTAGLQLFAMFARGVALQGLAIEWRSLPRSVVDGACMLGLQSAIGFTNHD